MRLNNNDLQGALLKFEHSTRLYLALAKLYCYTWWAVK